VCRNICGPWEKAEMLRTWQEKATLARRTSQQLYMVPRCATATCWLHDNTSVVTVSALKCNCQLITSIITLVMQSNGMDKAGSGSSKKKEKKKRDRDGGSAGEEGEAAGEKEKKKKKKKEKRWPAAQIDKHAELIFLATCFLRISKPGKQVCAHTDK
jgi:hypothetical protein